MSKAKDAIEAMTRIDACLLRGVKHTALLNKDKRTVMDALLALQAIEQRVDQERLAASTNPTHLYPCTDAEKFEREEDTEDE